MPRRRLTIAAMMLLVLVVGMTIALMRNELENRRLRALFSAQRQVHEMDSQILRPARTRGPRSTSLKDLYEASKADPVVPPTPDEGSAIILEP